MRKLILFIFICLIQLSIADVKIIIKYKITQEQQNQLKSSQTNMSQIKQQMMLPYSSTKINSLKKNNKA